MDFQGKVGRLIRGKKPEDFATLTNDPGRRLVLLLDSAGLQELDGLSGYQQLIKIGHTPDFIAQQIHLEGNRYKLVVWPKGGPDRLADWDNVGELVALAYPAVADKVRSQLSTLKHTPFAQIQRQAGYRFSEVDQEGADDPRYVTYERLQSLPGSAAQVRAFLYHVVQLKELFAGDGYTRKSDGSMGVAEYISPNLRLGDLPYAQVLDIEVEFPTEPTVRG